LLVPDDPRGENAVEEGLDESRPEELLAMLVVESKPKCILERFPQRLQRRK
jgi:hypothetical protein